MNYIKKFSEIGLKDVPLVGGKNASLGQMIADLTSYGIRVPDGFAITVEAYWYFIDHNNLQPLMRELLGQLTTVPYDIATLKKIGATLRVHIVQGQLPEDLAQEITRAYHELSKQYAREACDVAVRSSATAEDLPGASFAGQQETFLNVRGDAQLLQKCKESMASLFTDRAIVYRQEKGFDHFKVGLSVGVQKMVRSDKSCAAVSFSVDTETGFKDVVIINATYGLGEMLVKGEVIPDEFTVHKPTLKQGFPSIIRKQLGSKDQKMIYTDTGNRQRTAIVTVPEDMQQQWCLSDDEILELARGTLAIEECYTRLQGRWSPMDVEWAKDGLDNLLYCVQARPETVHAVKSSAVLRSFSIGGFTHKQLAEKTILTGKSVGSQIAAGVVRIVSNVADIGQVQHGDILVTHMTDPDWVPVMKRVAGIITDSGGRTCHAAIVARELSIPALVGTHNATHVLRNGQKVTLDCSRGNIGYVYDGIVPSTVQEVPLEQIKKLPTDIMVNSADPDSAFVLSHLPVGGVGLARIEFIISTMIKVHPLALIHPEKITDEPTRRQIGQLMHLYLSGREFFIHTLASGISMMAAAFYPRKVIVRLSDFKTNEYRNLIGGSYFEPHEENPMLGLRGASRYYHELYGQAFALECAAVKRARDIFGLKNIALLIPFVRTINEAQRVIDELKKHGLERGQDELSLVMMVEVPSNVFLIKEFSQFFDGFSIGSNDLTQLILGVDRDSAILAPLFKENDPAVYEAIKRAVQGAHLQKKYIGICGQAPSDDLDFADELVTLGIDTLSLNADAVIPFLLRHRKKARTSMSN